METILCQGSSRAAVEIAGALGICMGGSSPDPMGFKDKHGCLQMCKPDKADFNFTSASEACISLCL